MNYVCSDIHRQLGLLTRAGIKHIDIEDAYRRSGPEGLRVHPVEPHPNEGHLTVAEAIARAIGDHRQLP